MNSFKPFKMAIDQQYAKMSQHQMFRVDVDKDELYNYYLDSYPEGTNEIYRERREYDCSCCKNFIRQGGNVVVINPDMSLSTIWDVKINNPTYQVVADAMALYVKSKAIKEPFLHYEKHLGTNYNFEPTDNDPKKWEHFHFLLPAQFVKNKTQISTILGNSKTNKDMLQRGLTEISIDAINTVIELIKQKSIYRGEEYLNTVNKFNKIKKAYLKIPIKHHENWLWLETLKSDNFSNIKLRSSVIGTLLLDISNDISLDDAVKMFESKVAPANYKRTTALVTKKMIENAQNTIKDLDISQSLYRRHAIATDITINDVIYADKSTKPIMEGEVEALTEMLGEVKVDDKVIKNLDKVEEVSIDTFINDIVPGATSIELLFENKHNNNLMSLIAPKHEANSITKWGNNFTWSYNGEVADSMKENVKKAGGRINGVLRFSIQWNDDITGKNFYDLDAHCKESKGSHIYFSNKRSSSTNGTLDVDITSPIGTAVENIVWPTNSKLKNQNFKMYVNNYSSGKSTNGFSAEIEFNGEIHEYIYNKSLRGKENVPVATVSIKDNVFSIKHDLASKTSSRTLWNINTQKFHKVTMLMNSPNHWEGVKPTGNKHWFFILDNCKNEDTVRGFYNEFLSNELHQHRKVFEILGSKMKVEESNEQLSGLGFSSTQKNSVYCRVAGSFNRTIKINF